jgi:hypothetical protein
MLNVFELFRFNVYNQIYSREGIEYTLVINWNCLYFATKQDLQKKIRCVKKMYHEKDKPNFLALDCTIMQYGTTTIQL